tara:strand:- start:1467 stop:2024 length:558 start_codon:yes stop_codon:yes gene_type:complete
MPFTHIKNKLKSLMKQTRYEHSLRVANTAKLLAKHWKEDEENAYLAGLIHDCAKELNPQSFAKRNILLSKQDLSVYKKYQPIWHALVAPKFIPIEFNIINPSILTAAKWHATGSARMSKLSQIIYIADYIEPERKFDNKKIKELAFISLNKTCYEIANSTLFRLIKISATIHPCSLSCRNYYIEN